MPAQRDGDDYRVREADPIGCRDDHQALPGGRHTRLAELSARPGATIQATGGEFVLPLTGSAPAECRLVESGRT